MPTRRIVVAGALAAGVVPKALQAADEVVLDDASHLNATPVARHVVVRPGGNAAIEVLRRELKEAAAAGRPVAMGVARHSMGGQSLACQGTVFSYNTPFFELDRANRLYRAGSGTRWRDIIAQLDPLGFSPKVLQAYNDFGVASAFSVNAHGWPVPYGPFGSTVRSLRLMLADGSVVPCSRAENAELFRHAMGGYGLFGIIVDLDVEMATNSLLQPSFEPIAADAFASRFVAVCAEPGVQMAYGRLDVSRNRFLEGALLVSFRPSPRKGPLPPVDAGGGIVSYLSREVYRAETGSDWGKRFRWFMESKVGPRMAADGVTRNTLLNESQAALADSNPRRTDILHEYFLPPQRLAAFFAACREVIPKSKIDLLNVTLRYLAPDGDSVLAYAPTERIAAVMSFSQPRTVEADVAMERMTRELIDRVLAIGGTFYLPYRLHARPDQLERAYPAIRSFANRKRHYDPKRLFRNFLWDKWLEPMG